MNEINYKEACQLAESINQAQTFIHVHLPHKAEQDDEETYVPCKIELLNAEQYGSMTEEQARETAQDIAAIISGIPDKFIGRMVKLTFKSYVTIDDLSEATRNNISIIADKL